MILTIFQAIAAIPKIATLVESLVLQWLEFRQIKDESKYNQKMVTLQATIMALKASTTDEQRAKFSRLLYDIEKN